MAQNKERDTVIIGSGVAGVGTLEQIRRSHPNSLANTRVFEASPRIGGRAAYFTVEGNGTLYRVPTGAAYTTRRVSTDSHEKLLLADFVEEQDLVPTSGDTHLYSVQEGRLRSTPMDAPLSVLSNPSVPFSEKLKLFLLLKDVLGYTSADLHDPRSYIDRKGNMAGKTVYEYAQQRGIEIFSKTYLDSLAQSVAGLSDLETSMEFIIAALMYAVRHKTVFIRHGVESVLTEIIEQSRDEGLQDVERGKQVVAVERDGTRRFRVILSDNEEVCADQIVFATPLPAVKRVAGDGVLSQQQMELIQQHESIARDTTVVTIPLASLQAAGLSWQTREVIFSYDTSHVSVHPEAVRFQNVAFYGIPPIDGQVYATINTDLSAPDQLQRAMHELAFLRGAQVMHTARWQHAHTQPTPEFLRAAADHMDWQERAVYPVQIATEASQGGIDMNASLQAGQRAVRSLPYTNRSST